MQVELKRIQQEVGITFIYVTHDQEEAMTMSDRIAVMNRGRTSSSGDPESLYERPDARASSPASSASATSCPARSQGTDGRYATVKLADETMVRAPSALVDGKVRRQHRRPPREDPAARTGRGDPTRRAQPAARRRPRRVVLGVSTQYQVEARGGARLTVYEQNVERATRSELWAPGEEV